MSRPYSNLDGPEALREAFNRIRRLERVGWSAVAVARMQQAIQSTALMEALPATATSVYVLDHEPEADLTPGSVWKDVSLPNPLVYTWDGAQWQKTEDQHLVDAMAAQSRTIDIFRQIEQPVGDRFIVGSLWKNPATGSVRRWSGQEWASTLMTGIGEIGQIQDDLIVARDDIDAIMAGANGRIVITYTTVTRFDKPGPAPAPDPTRFSGDIHRNRAFDNGEIFAEWMWDADAEAWLPVNFGDEILRSLDVGKLTAGTAVVDSGVINKLRVGILTLASVTPEMLTSAEELSVNPSWSRSDLRDTPPYSLPTGMSFSTTGSWQYMGSSNVLVIAGGATASSRLRLTNTFPVTPGELIHGKVVARKSTATTPPAGYHIGLEATWLNSSGAAIGTSVYEITTPVDTTWRSYESIFNAPDGAVEVYLSVTGGPTVHTWIVGQTSVRRVMHSIDDEGIQTVISPSGVEVSILIPSDEPGGFERVTLTSMGRFYSAFDPATGGTSTMTGEEVSTGTLSVREDIIIGGQSLLEWMASTPKGIVVNDMATAAGSISASELGYREVGFLAEGGRAYLFFVHVEVLQSADGTGFAFLRKTEATPPAEAPEPEITSPEFTRARWRGDHDNFTFFTRFVPSVTENTRWLLSARGGGARTAQILNSRIIVVEEGSFRDLDFSGRYSNGGGVPTDPGPTPPPAPNPTPPPREREHISDFVWSRTYSNKNNDTSGWVENYHVRQGRGGTSNYMGLLGMSTAARTAAMAGTIREVAVYLYHHAPMPSGTARISTHREASMPAYSAGTSINLYDSYTSRSMPRDSDGWIILPSSTHPAFKAGLTRGIAVGSTSGAWSLMDFLNQLAATPEWRPKIRITYEQ